MSYFLFLIFQYKIIFQYNIIFYYKIIQIINRQLYAYSIKDTWYNGCNYSAITHTSGKPESHSFTNCSTQRSADLEYGDKNSRWYRHRRTYDGKDELKPKPVSSILLYSYNYIYSYNDI